MRTLTIKEPDRHVIGIQALAQGWQAVRLRSVRLTPAAPGTEWRCRTRCNTW